MNRKPIRVGVLGATGAVGQRFISLLDTNPWFTITAVAASERSTGARYADACTWRLPGDCPDSVRDLPVQPCEPGLDCDIVFSALPADIARDVEVQMAAAGYGVFSNASAHRMDPDTPLLIPEVNPDHLALIPIQREKRGWDKGFIVTNPNCSTIGLTLALKPLHDAYGVRIVMVTTMQALSGAGYPGVPSLDILDNVIPYIKGEEEKMIQEPRKILGDFVPTEGKVRPAFMLISPSCNRVAAIDGHLETVSVELEREAAVEEVIAAFRNFTSLPYELGCPSAVNPTIIVRDEPDRPQTRRDRDAGNGMTITVGRVRPCEVLEHKFVVLSHNTIRGAAGASILNAELMVAQGMI
ncbi:MAG: aspartate-semialdehyde dehydrogenase [Chloroflexi bacterium]|jgi:aspartate-semialdehyde dehydrogenase|nr:aspartate-semialdehyde dehydrogenase [Chloroflexota bacterium]